MYDWQVKTPIVLIIFKRPQETQTVFEAIRQAKWIVLMKKLKKRFVDSIHKAD